MNQKDFKAICDTLQNGCDSVLTSRATAYSDDEDRLGNFKQISALTGVPATVVCLVLQSKHIVALAKAVREEKYSKVIEYITDIINYQRLLHALILEAQKDMPKGLLGTIPLLRFE